MMPFITAFFLPRNGTDRPKVVPDGVKNFAFIGQFAESTRDCIFTTEYSVRTAMEAVYQLLNIERGVPEVFVLFTMSASSLNRPYSCATAKKLPIPSFAKHWWKRRPSTVALRSTDLSECSASSNTVRSASMSRQTSVL